MSAIEEEKPPIMSVEEYLAFERDAEIRHEFLGGQIYSMSGGSQRHNLIALRLASDIDRHLRGKPCRAFINDMKVRVTPGGDDYFYYPDIAVTCDPRDREHSHHISHPKLLIEVLSPGTARIDRREKLFAYMQIETLEEYVLLEQDFPEARIHRPADKWKAEIATERLHLRSLDLSIDLGQLFAGLE